MAKVLLTAEERKADRIMRCLPAQRVLAREFGESPQTISYRMTHMWKKQIVDLIKLLDLAGYEIREKEEV